MFGVRVCASVSAATADALPPRESVGVGLPRVSFEGLYWRTMRDRDQSQAGRDETSEQE